MESSEAPTQVEVPRRRGRPPKSRGVPEHLAPIDLSRDTVAIHVPDEPEVYEKPEIELDGEVELAHVAMPMMPLNGGIGLTLGGAFASGFSVSGIVRRLVLQKNGVIRAVIEIGSSNLHFKTGRFAFLYFRDWQYAEPYHDNYQDISEEKALGT